MGEEQKTPQLIKSVDNAAELYVRTAGGYEAYRQIISQRNEGAPEFNEAENEEFKTQANCLDHAFNDYDRVGSSSTPAGMVFSQPTDKIKVEGDKTNGNAKDFKEFVGATLRDLVQAGASIVQPDELAYRMEQAGGPSHSYLVAMYAKPQLNPNKPSDGDIFDFHFVRQDKEGGWSHKFGSENSDDAKVASKLDRAGNPITDPLTANMGPYQFVTFLEVPSNGIDVGDGPRYNTGGLNGVDLTPDQRRQLDEQIMPPNRINTKPPGAAGP